MVIASQSAGRLRPRDVLPPHAWHADVSRKNGKVYYRHAATGETAWELPVGAVLVADEDTYETAQSASSRRGSSGAASQSGGSSTCALDRKMSGLSYLSGASGTRMKCICQICDCGKHRCKVHDKKPGYGDINSSYRNDFPWHDAQYVPTQREAKGFLQTAVDPSHFDTNYSTAYKGHDVRREVRRPQSAPLTRSKFCHTSTYRTEHGPKELTGAVRRREQQSRPPKVPFTHRSTTQVDFVPHASDPRHLMRPPDAVVPNTAFNGNSTYRTLYTDPPPEAIQPRALAMYAVSSLPEDRDFMSTKQISYIRPELTVCPAALLPKKMPSTHTGHTHYHRREGTRLDADGTQVSCRGLLPLTPFLSE